MVMCLENMVIDSLTFSDLVGGETVINFSVLLKNVEIKQESFIQEGTGKLRGRSQIKAWENIIKNINNINIQGNISFSHNLDTDYEVCEYLYRYFKKEGRLQLAETLHRNMLEKYKKIKSTSYSDKVILWSRYHLSDHQTSIFLPILWIAFIWTMLLTISFHCSEYFPSGDLFGLMLPWSIVADPVPTPKQFQDSTLISFSIETIYLLIRIFSAVCYFQILMMLKKFAFKEQHARV